MGLLLKFVAGLLPYFLTGFLLLIFSVPAKIFLIFPSGITPRNFSKISQFFPRIYSEVPPGIFPIVFSRSFSQDFSRTPRVFFYKEFCCFSIVPSGISPDFRRSSSSIIFRKFSWSCEDVFRSFSQEFSLSFLEFL